ncbi:MAG: aminotransferase class I/II-fold pyridoxal phosphate-dependent enzyme [Candidatus Dormibacterales bacterium]
MAALPENVPFVAPETLERRLGRPFRARLGANESAFGASPLALRAMAAELSRSALYGDPECWVLRSALASHLGVGAESVAVGSGIDDLQGLVVRALMDPGDVAVMSQGAYPTFAYHVAGSGGRVEAVLYRDDRNDLEALAAAARRTGATLVFLANPDNPTGAWVEAGELEAFLDLLPPGSLLVLDEAYVEFAPGDRLPIDAGDPRLVRLRTFSKAYGMAGLRVGYAVGEPRLLAAFDRIRLHFGVNRVAQAGAKAALSDGGFLAEVVQAVARGRLDYLALADRAGIGALPSWANFVAFDLGTRGRAERVLEGLGRRGVFGRKPAAPPLDRCLRLTVGTEPERQIAAEALTEAVRETA